MRLSSRVKNIILNAIKDNFGDVEVYIFGSRVDDTKRGGDIDIAIKANISRDDFKRKKIKTIKELLRQEFLFDVDIVQYDKSDCLLYDEIREVAKRIEDE